MCSSWPDAARVHTYGNQVSRSILEHTSAKSIRQSTAVRAYTAFLAYIVQLRVLRMRSALCVLLVVASLNE